MTFVFHLVTPEGTPLVHDTEDGQRPVVIASMAIREKNARKIAAPGFFAPGNGKIH